MTNQERNEYRGFSLFNDLEDKQLQLRNRAVVMSNMAEQYTKDKKITVKGASLILGYFECIPANERKALEIKFTETMKERGFIADGK